MDASGLRVPGAGRQLIVLRNSSPSTDLPVPDVEGQFRDIPLPPAVSGLSALAGHGQTMQSQQHGTEVPPEEGPEPQATIRCAAAGNSAELVERIRTGDASAWRELVHEHEPRMRRIASQYRLSRQDVDDVIQLVWLRCLEHLGQLTHADSLWAWLNTICRRECLRLATRERREALLGESIVVSLIDQSHEERDPFTTATLRDDYARLGRAITALPDRQRLVLLELLERQGRGYADVSRCLGLPVGSIGPTWARALARLRRDPGLADLNPAS